jgi:hypothetical protein
VKKKVAVQKKKILGKKKKKKEKKRMGSVSSKNAVQLTVAPTSWMGLGVMIGQTSAALSLVSSTERSLLGALLSKKHEPCQKRALIQLALALAGLVYYGRNTYYSVRRGEVLPQRRRADVVSLLLFIAVFILRVQYIVPLERSLASKSAAHWPDQTFEMNRARLARFHKIKLALVVALASFQRKAILFN